MFKELLRMCISHSPLITFLKGERCREGKKRFEKQGQIGREKNLICENSNGKKSVGDGRENSRTSSTWFESQCRPSLYQISVEGMAGHQTSFSLSPSLWFSKREIEKKKYLV